MVVDSRPEVIETAGQRLLYQDDFAPGSFNESTLSLSPRTLVAIEMPVNKHFFLYESHTGPRSIIAYFIGLIPSRLFQQNSKRNSCANSFSKEFRRYFCPALDVIYPEYTKA
jgi:hypothetical protein